MLLSNSIDCWVVTRLQVTTLHHITTLH